MELAAANSVMARIEAVFMVGVCVFQCRVWDVVQLRNRWRELLDEEGDRERKQTNSI